MHSHVSSTVNIDVKVQPDGKPSAHGNKTLIFENYILINQLMEVETNVVLWAVTEYIYNMCHFVAHADHMDSATYFIFGKIGYVRPEQGHDVQNIGHLQDDWHW